MSVGTPEAVAVIGGIGLLLAWSLDRFRSEAAARDRREAACPHRPEWQETLRMNTHRLGRVVPGSRMVVKRCRGCGRQRPLYGALQSWDSYVDEFRQETRDRTVEFRARSRAHRSELARAGRDRRTRSPQRPDSR